LATPNIAKLEMLTMLVKNVNALSIWNLGKLQNLRIEREAIQRKIKLKK
jgi:hypothetical protein